jgi:hypothetical protein
VLILPDVGNSGAAPAREAARCFIDSASGDIPHSAVPHSRLGFGNG